MAQILNLKFNHLVKENSSCRFSTLCMVYEIFNSELVLMISRMDNQVLILLVNGISICYVMKWKLLIIVIDNYNAIINFYVCFFEDKIE